MKTETVVMLNTLTNSKLKFNEEKEETSMCLALDELREEIRAEGRKEGMELGRQEGCETSKYNLTRKMLANHEPIEKIEEYTGYSQERIKDIEKELFINELISVGTLVIYFRTEP